MIVETVDVLGRGECGERLVHNGFLNRIQVVIINVTEGPDRVKTDGAESVD